MTFGNIASLTHTKSKLRSVQIYIQLSLRATNSILEARPYPLHKVVHAPVNQGARCTAKAWLAVRAEKINASHIYIPTV